MVQKNQGLQLLTTGHGVGLRKGVCAQRPCMGKELSHLNGALTQPHGTPLNASWGLSGIVPFPH